MKSQKRFFAEEKDFRGSFARDRDRILHCSSFRRLEYKTQVFLNHEGDYFRTRLTHSLEVSQIARTMARELGMNETLTEAIALAHDLGHTPFGHVGGEELDRLLKNDGRKNGFEHNFQSFRVLTRLEKRYAAYDGLNLTYATLEGVLKHSFPYEKEFMPDCVKELFALDRHPSIEAMIVDHADAIAYTSHDIDDGIKYGLIDFEDLVVSDLAIEIDMEIKALGLDKKEYIYRHRFVAALIKYLVEDFIRHSSEKVKPFQKKGPLCSQIPSHEPLPVGFSSETAGRLVYLKEILFDKLYRHRNIVAKMHAGKECIRALYRAFGEDADLLPARQKMLIEKRSQKRVIADYIASMTDRYALKSYHEIYGISLR